MSHITDFLGSSAGIQILELFLRNSGKDMYQIEVINEIKETVNPKLSFVTAKKWLSFFVKYGLLTDQKRGRFIQYMLNKDNPVVRQFKVLINTARIFESIENMRSDDTEIYLFGSTARGDDDEDSDIDLLLIGEADNAKLANVKDAVANTMNREVNLVSYTRAQYSSLYRENKSFYDNVEKDKIRLL
jgi:predicted nucleotidyltransferase